MLSSENIIDNNVIKIDDGELSDTEKLIFDEYLSSNWAEEAKNNILKNKAKANAYNKKSYYKRKEKLKDTSLLIISETQPTPKGRKQKIITDADIKLYNDTHKLKETKIKQKRGPKPKIYPASDVINIQEL